MPTLALNGWRIPVAQANQTDVEIGGSWMRAFGGLLRRQRRAVKRQWSLTTSPMRYDDAVALQGMLLAVGEQLPGDDDVFSAKGTPPLQDNGLSIVSGAGRYGGALWPRRPVYNLLTQNVATGTETLSGTLGFGICQGNGPYANTTAGASTVESSTEQAHSGSRSVKASFAYGNYYGLRCTAAVAADTQYTFSCYLKSIGSAQALQISAIAQNDQSTTPANIGFATTTDWARYALTFTTPPGATSLELRVNERIDGGYAFYADDFMLQPGGAATAWTPTTTPAVNVGYRIDAESAWGSYAGLTLCAWAISPAADGAVLMALTDHAIDSSSAIVISYLADNQIKVTTPVGFFTAPWPTPNSYAHITLVITSSAAQLYRNGALVATGMGLAPSALVALSILWCGNINAQDAWGGYIDEIVYVPYAMSAAQIMGLATLPQTPALQPALVATGSLVGPPTTVIGHDIRSTYLAMSQDGVWQPAMTTVDFSLSEV
jgi:hypothetical protein